MSGHTPGPWVVKGALILPDGPSFDWICSMQTSNQPGWEEDAYLIAASPNMLAALKAILTYANAFEGQLFEDVAAIAYAAVNLATGRP